MIDPFPRLQQPPGSNSCLPTVVRAVLLWHNEAVTQAQVSEWCSETQDGCWIDAALDGLRQEGYDVEELTEEGIRAILNDEDPQPVIVTIKTPTNPFPMDHAVVVLGVHSQQSGSVTREITTYMDPLTGSIEQDTTGLFWQYWDFAGQRAFILRP